MQSSIVIAGTNISYSIKVSRRAKRMSVTVFPGGVLVVTVPKKTSIDVIENLLHRKSTWIRRVINRLSTLPRVSRIEDSKTEYKKYKTIALKTAQNKVQEFNTFYRYLVKSISIRNQKTRWGSCSRRGSLNFNYKIAFLPEPLVDYLVVHELCHLGEFNHSSKFWDLVAKTIPDYKEKRTLLKRCV
ncbi:MAG TPA: SprT family zinc-dependent metalloprotease [Candidatus Paceibacterota bacterium]|nr:SprT family zinc-dependent metalloprotease [Candidatus Paceibacterota bacterium]